MPKFLPKKRSTRVIVFIWAAVLMVAVAVVGYYYFAKPAYKSWREKRANNIARQHLAEGDFPAALAAARKALQYNQSNVDAWKLAVEITEKQETPQVVIYQQGLAGLEPTLENKLKLIRLAIQHGYWRNALDAVNKVGPEGAESAEFYELATRVAQAMRNQTKAKYYLMSLVKLQPSNNKARLDLAQIRLTDGFEENKPSIRAEIRELANDPALRVRALTLLLVDAVQAQKAADALEIAAQLSTAKDIPPATQLMVAEAYRQSDPKRFAPYIENLKTAFAGDPATISLLASYLSTHEMTADARKWIESLPDETRANESVQLSYSATLLTLGDYAALDAFLRPIKWSENNEYARQAYLAYAARKRGNERAFNEFWRLAVIEVGSDPRRLQSLLSRAGAWGWPEQRMELVWKKFSLDPSDKTSRQQIYSWERARQNTEGLNRLFGRINENEPGDRDSKNNYTYTSLLLGTSLDRAHTAARENYDSDRDNPNFVGTYALSLLKQNKPQEALQLLESLNVAVLADPQRSLLHGVLLMANGRFDDGLERTAHLKLDQFLPEERRLYKDATEVAARSRRDQATVARLATLGSETGAGDRKSWVKALPAAYRADSVQLDLADSLYSIDDYAGLESTLRGERWEENDFLRLTLLAYAQKNLGRENDFRATWRLAMNSVASRSDHLAVLEDICERWGWNAERLEILGRIVQRDPDNDAALAELAAHFRQSGQTNELARIYGTRVDRDVATTTDKSLYAYYSLLTNTNLSRAHSLAQQAYNAAPDVPIHAKTYALSLYKQSRPADAWSAIEKLIAVGETGPAQLTLLRAAITLEQGQGAEAGKYLENFDPSSALPEEVALADSLAKTIAAKNS